MKAATNHETVTLTVPSEHVEQRAGRDGKPFHLARLPEGTRAAGRDLSDGLICSEVAHKSTTREGLTDLELPADATKTVKLLTQKGGQRCMEAVRVSARELCTAVADALARKHDLAILRRATELLEAGDASAAREALKAIGGDSSSATIMPPNQPSAATKPTRPRPDARDPIRAYEAVGILPAWQPLCSVSTRSATEVVPERFAYVAIDRQHCVTREWFNQLLGKVRSKPPCHGGVLDEHSIGYVAKQLAHPFARSRTRAVAEVNGIGVDVTPHVMPIPGASLSPRAGWEPLREVVDLGVASIATDSLALVECMGMSPDEADVVCEWLQKRFESDLALATGRVGAGHVSALLRSPDATRLLVEEGARLENPATGEWMMLNRESGEVECAMQETTSPNDDEQTLLDWHLLRVASDDAWRVVPEDAVALATAHDGPLANLVERAREAYRKDDWLTPKARVANIPTRENAERTLSLRDLPTAPSRPYSLRDECLGSTVATVPAMQTRSAQRSPR